MSTIPKSAMPHAKTETGTDQDEQGQQAGSGSAFSQIAGKAREYPKTAIAAGAAVAAGVAAAAVIGTRGRGGSSGEGKSGRSKKGKSG